MPNIKEIAKSFIFVLVWASIVLGFLSCVEKVNAKELAVISGSWSTHLDGGDYNEVHRSVGFKYYEERTPAKHGYNQTTHSVMRFTNSYRNTGFSYLYGKSGCRDDWWLKVCLGWTGGVAFGYDEQGWPVMPVAGGVLDVGYEEVNLNVMYVPFANVLTYQLDTIVWEW